MVDFTSKVTLEKATVNDLKQELKNAGLTQSGVKSELVDRLWTWAQENRKQPAQPAPAAQPTSEQKSPQQQQAQKQSSKQQQQAPAAQPATQREPASEHPQGQPEQTQQQQQQAAAAEAQSKHAKIVFDDLAAKRAEAKKLEVIKPKKPAEGAPAPAAKPALQHAQLSEAERAKLRAEKFKDPEVEKKKNRAERFNVASPELESERARKRAERFGTEHPDIEAEKTRKRKERFGIEDPAAKLQSRAERFKPLENAKPAPSFGTVLSREELKARKERQERFQTTS